jgi:hypothetical protein
VDVRLLPHPAQHLGSFLDVVQTIKQLEHFRSRLYAEARVHEPIDWHNQLAHSRVAPSCASTPKARGLRHGEYAPCIRLSRTPTPPPHPPLPEGIGMASRVSPFLLSTALHIPQGASHVHDPGLLRRPVGGGYPISLPLSAAPQRAAGYTRHPCRGLFSLLAT